MKLGGVSPALFAGSVVRTACWQTAAKVRKVEDLCVFCFNSAYVHSGPGGSPTQGEVSTALIDATIAQKNRTKN